MKRLSLFVLCSLVLFSCTKKSDEDPETIYKPLLMERTVLETSISFTTPKRIKKTGKIYRYGDYIFIAELYEGIHVLDNSNPENPENKGFIKIPGNADMAIKEGRLYVDNATDLVTIDLTNPIQPIVVDRDRNVFPELPPPDNRELPAIYQPENRPENTVIVKWQRSI